jgi:hypothetical protein
MSKVAAVRRCGAVYKTSFAQRLGRAFRLPSFKVLPPSDGTGDLNCTEKRH